MSKNSKDMLDAGADVLVEESSKPKKQGKSKGNFKQKEKHSAGLTATMGELFDFKSLNIK